MAPWELASRRAPAPVLIANAALEASTTDPADAHPATLPHARE